MLDRFTDALLTPLETAVHLQIPERTIGHWLAQDAGGHPLVHSVRPERRGRPSVPFVAVVEAYVLRALRTLGLSSNKIKDAAVAVRAEFGNEYGADEYGLSVDQVQALVRVAA